MQENDNSTTKRLCREAVQSLGHECKDEESASGPPCLLSVPCSVLADFVFQLVSIRTLGCVLMACLKLQPSTADAILRLARCLKILRREGESAGSLLYAIGVMRPGWRRQGAGTARECGISEDDNDGSAEYDVYTFGCDKSGQLGHGDDEYRRGDVWDNRNFRPRIVEELKGKEVVKIATAMYFTVVLTEQGEVYTFGGGGSGALGHGNTDSLRTPRIVEALKKERVIALSAGAYSVAVITSKGELYTFGLGNKGQLGHGNRDSLHTPRKVQAFHGKRVVGVAMGYYHMAVVTSDGKMFTCGGYGAKLSHNPTEENELSDVTVPTEIDGQVKGKYIFQVAAGWHHTAVVTSDGEMFTCGSSNTKQTGHSATTEPLLRSVDALEGKRVESISAGTNYTVAITETGEMMIFTAHMCVSPHRWDLTKVMSSLPCRTVQFSMSTNHAAFLLADGRAFTVGSGAEGKLGQGVTYTGRYEQEVKQSNFRTWSEDDMRVVQVATGLTHTAMLVRSPARP